MPGEHRKTQGFPVQPDKKPPPELSLRRGFLLVSSGFEGGCRRAGQGMYQSSGNSWSWQYWIMALRVIRPMKAP